MSPSSQSSVPVASLTILTGLICAAAVFSGLSIYGRPDHFADRVAQLTGRVAEIKRLSSVSPTARAYVPGALCPSASDGSVEAAAAALQARAGQLGLETVDLSTQAAPEASGGVIRIALHGEFTGPYPAAITFVGQLGQQTPKLFADRVDLIDRVSEVTLRFSGHFYCSTVG